MLNRVIILFALLYIPLSAHARIVETAHIADVVTLIDEETWFLVDLEDTMYESKHTLGNSVEPLEEDFVPTLQMLQNRGIVVMGLTKRNPKTANNTLRQVSSLGFDFRITAPSKETFSIQEFKSSPLYKKGILFVSAKNKKGKVLVRFLDIIKMMPRKVVFIDDKRKNVEDLEQTLSLYGVDYIGVHYTAILNVKPIYSREIADFQYKYLEKILSNEAAQILMEKGLD